MEENLRHHRGRYDVSGNVEAEYVDDARMVLVNKKGITDVKTLQRLEEAALAKAYETLTREVRMNTPMTCSLLCHVHERVFGELFHWAGRWRTVWISKPGVTWPAPDFLDRNMATFERNVLEKYPAAKLEKDEAFCAAASEIQGEFLVIHPFREGNARTIKLLTDLLAAQTGRPVLVYDESERGRDQYIEAAKAAFTKNYRPMVDVIRRALEKTAK